MFVDFSKCHYFIIQPVRQVVMETVLISNDQMHKGERINGAMLKKNPKKPKHKTHVSLCGYWIDSSNITNHKTSILSQRVFSGGLYPVDSSLSFSRVFTLPLRPPLLPLPPPFTTCSLSSIRNDGVTLLFHFPISLPCYITCVSKHPLCLSNRTFSCSVHLSLLACAPPHTHTHKWCQESHSDRPSVLSHTHRLHVSNCPQAHTYSYPHIQRNYICGFFSFCVHILYAGKKTLHMYADRHTQTDHCEVIL